MFQFPWLRSRKRLIIHAFFYVFIFISVYYLRFNNYFIFGNKFEIFLFMLISLVTNYIVGLFDNSNEKLYISSSNVLQISKELSKTFITYFLLTSIYILYSNFFSFYSGMRDLKNFYFFLLIVSIFNYFFKLIFKYFLRNFYHKKESWLLISEEEKFYNLKKELDIQKIKFIDLNFYTPSMLYESDWNRFNGYIISENLINKELINKVKKKVIKGIPFFYLNDWCAHVLNRYPVSILYRDFENNFFLKMFKSNYNFRIKRIGDLIFGGLLLFLSLPIFILVIILIKLEDNGKVFYFQKRNGIFEKEINLIKFRTMREDAEEDSGPTWSQRNDKRITNIGKFLRLTRIDELPQLLLVIKGEMSLIGPRPERPEIDNDLKIKIPFYSQRFNFKPGLSGWAQVNYPYGASLKDSEVKLSYDLFYIRNFSLWLDFLILFKTIKLVFNAKGALPNT